MRRFRRVSSNSQAGYGQKNPRNNLPYPGLVRRDVNKMGTAMTVAFTRMGCRAAPAETTARETSSDEMLIKRIADGDRLAMRLLFARHQLPLYRWLVRIVRDESLAEDLLSEVFLDVWRQAVSFEGRSSVRRWACSASCPM